MKAVPSVLCCLSEQDVAHLNPTIKRPSSRTSPAEEGKDHVLDSVTQRNVCLPLCHSFNVTEQITKVQNI